jgi:drug/metabolite transporter (DMT)-like permease
VRHLGTDLPAVQSAFLRFGWGLVLMAPFLPHLFRRSTFAGFPASAPGWFAVRALFHTMAVVLWFFAMARLPVAEVTAIGYLNPVFVTIGGVLIFGEALARRRVLATLAALVGALVILRPGLRDIGPGHLAQLAAAACFAGSYLCVKRLSAFADPGLIVAMMTLTVSLGLLPFAPWVWVPVSLYQLGWSAVVALCGTLGHYCMTRAFVAAPLSVTQPVTFLNLVWATTLGSVAFGESPDPFVLLGGAIIILAISLLTWRESLAQRRAALDSATH